MVEYDCLKIESDLFLAITELIIEISEAEEKENTDEFPICWFV